jgi:haloacetate dehalogenase
MSMTDAADLFPGFKTHHVETDVGSFFVRTGGQGQALLLLHGYPQTHAEWHAVAQRLAERFSVVVMDLRGYGASCIPASRDGAGMAKRLMGQDAIAVMAKLGHATFRLAGHDRGGRVAYRLAYDHPERLVKVAVIDIIPTASMFRGMGKMGPALKAYHWLFLAQPAPFPETMIEAATQAFLDHTLASWTARKSLSVFDPRALEAYRKAFVDPARIHATCEDYRAGALLDRQQDEDDMRAGRKIMVPMLAIWGDAGIPASGISPLDVWREFARDITGVSIPSGHFVPEENPDACATALLDFFR